MIPLENIEYVYTLQNTQSVLLYNLTNSIRNIF